MAIVSSASGAEEIVDRIRAVLGLGVHMYVNADLYCCDLDDLVPVAPPPYPSRVVAVDPPADRQHFEAAGPAAVAEYDEAAEDGDRMFAVMRQDRLVAWTRFTTTDVCVGSGNVLVRGLWVGPAARTTGIDTALVGTALRAVHHDTATRAAGMVGPGDDDLRRVLCALGFKGCGSTQQFRPLACLGPVR